MKSSLIRITTTVSSKLARASRAVLPLVALALFALSSNTFAVDYGQIKGLITNKATKEPLIGASVEVVGTDLGAITDVDGRFNVRLVPPGDYTLKVTMLGMQEVEVTEVRVFSELTTDQDVQMSDKTTDIGDKITVVAVPDAIDKHETSSSFKLQKEAIQKKPVTSVDDLIKNVSGVVTSDDGEIHVRGGRAGEVAYYVDGVNINDPVGGPGPVQGGVSLVAGSVQEIQVIKDGFDPEYGNALSGVIKITSQTGSPEKTAMNLRFITDDFGTEKLNKFSRNYDNFRFTISGPDPILTSKVFPALGLNFLEGKELTYFLYLEMEKQDGRYRYDDYIDVPSNRQFDGTSLFGINLPERNTNSYNLNSNIAIKPRNNLKFILSYQSTFNRFGDFNWNNRNTPGTATQNERDWRLASLKMTHSLSKDLNYEVIFSYKRNKILYGPGDPDHPGKIMLPNQFLLQDQWESFTDADRDGRYTAPEPILNLLPDTVGYGSGLSGPGYNSSSSDVYTDVQSGESIGNPLINATWQYYWWRDFSFNQFNNGVFEQYNNGVDNRGARLANTLEGEPYSDLNGNGRWDAGDPFRDTNGNGLFDDERRDVINVDEQEPFQDGDISLGEPFTDINANGVFDPGVDQFNIALGPENQDLNRNSVYDGPEPFLWDESIPYIDLNGNGLFDRPNQVYDLGELFEDLNGNGVYDGKDQFLDVGSYDSDTRWHKHLVSTLGVELKVNRTFSNHDLKGGFEIHQDDFDYQDIRRSYQEYNGRPDGGAYPTLGSSRDFFTYKPTAGAVYFRDKLEYGSMIASLGFRWDFFVQSDGLLDIALNDDLSTGVILGDRSKMSPRIGFSYPISDKAKVYFNYGHFYKLPQYEFLYFRNTSAASINDAVGNYNLDYEKTIQYSFGVQYKLSDSYALQVGGYYKDEFDKVTQGDVQFGAIRFRQFQNHDYARSRGFEMELTKRRGLIKGQMSYAYAFAFGKASQTNQNFLTDFEINNEPLSEHAMSFDVRHSVKTGVQLVVPKTVDASLFGIPIFNDWTLSLEGLFESGRPFTPDRSLPGLSLPQGTRPQENSLRLPSRIFFDVRMEKNFKGAGLRYTAILWVENIFDEKFVRTVFGTTGLPNTSNNRDDLVVGGTSFDANPLHYDAGREIRFGLQMNL
jgi:outer membrane receptor protein involved in Fe transport